MRSIITNIYRTVEVARMMSVFSGNGAPFSERVSFIITGPVNALMLMLQ